MIKTKRTLLSAILLVLGAMLVCFGALAMPTKQTLAAEPAAQAEQSTGQTTTMQKDDGSTELNAGEGTAYLHKGWRSEIVINGGTTGDLSTVTSITFNYQADLSGITGYNVGATSVTDTSTPKQSTIIASVNGTDITIYSSQPTVAFPEDSHCFFSSLRALKTIDWGNVTINTSNVTDIWGIFADCNSLVSVDVSDWNVGKVHSFQDCFAFCYNLKELDVSNWDVSNATDIEYMFSNCFSLTSLNVSKWNTSKVENMKGVFQSCYNLTELDLSSKEITNNGKTYVTWETNIVYGMSELFGCMYTANGKVSSEYIAKAYGPKYGIYGASGLEDNFFAMAVEAAAGVSIEDEDTARTMLESQFDWEMEKGYSRPMALKNINMSGWEIGDDVDVKAMFLGCTNLTSLIVPTTCAQEIAFPVTLYDTDGNEYTSLSSATNGKMLTSSLPAAGFDGAELVATTSVGVIALLAVGYALIGIKKRKENKFGN